MKTMIVSIEERKFVKKWLGAMVYEYDVPHILYVVDAIDLVKGQVHVSPDTWVLPSLFRILKSTKKKHWNRPTQFVRE